MSRRAQSSVAPGDPGSLLPCSGKVQMCNSASLLIGERLEQSIFPHSEQPDFWKPTANGLGGRFFLSSVEIWLSGKCLFGVACLGHGRLSALCAPLWSPF